MGAVTVGRPEGEPTGQPARLVVLLHGFGAPGDDLVPLASVLHTDPETWFLFPEAPLILDDAGQARAWWMVDPHRFRPDSAGRIPDLSRHVPPGLGRSREYCQWLVEEAERRCGVRSPAIAVGGFSQGAMLALDVVLRTDRPFAGLLLLSTTMIARDEWLPLLPKRRGLPVLQAHGTGDQVLPFFLAERLRDELVTAGLPVDWIPFRGGHEIPPMVQRRMAAFLASLPLSR